MNQVDRRKLTDERKPEFRTTVNGTLVNRVYTATDLQEHESDPSLPGEYPFTRGIRSNGYRSRLWTVREYSGFGTVAETNRRYKYLFQEGNTGFSVAFHLPTQIGYDSDHPMSSGEVGKAGTAVDSLQDMEQLWKGISLNDCSTSLTANATAPIIMAMYIVAAEKQGAKKEQLAGTIQNDILKEYIARNTYIFDPEHSMRLVLDLCVYCAQNMPRWNSISICGYHMREAGATAIQEAAFTLANGITYVEAMLKRGIAIDLFAPRFTFHCACNMNLLEEVAKFRAMRRVWAKVMKQRFHAQDPRSLMFRLSIQNDGFTSTAQQPLNNIVRTTIQALASVLASCQSLATTSYDEALALPTEKSVTVALRTQQIIAYESGVADTADPLGGSYYIEYLTSEIEKGINDYLSKIESIGGVLEAIKRGYIQGEIASSAYEYQKAVDSGEQVVVGVNKFAFKQKSIIKFNKIDGNLDQTQVEKLNKLRQKRDNRKVIESLKKVKRVAMSSENIMPVLIEAVKTYATVGEISDVLREIFGEYRDYNPIS